MKKEDTHMKSSKKKRGGGSGGGGGCPVGPLPSPTPAQNPAKPANHNDERWIDGMYFREARKVFLWAFPKGTDIKGGLVSLWAGGFDSKVRRMRTRGF